MMVAHMYPISTGARNSYPIRTKSLMAVHT
jgi:hypothetical protein